MYRALIVLGLFLVAGILGAFLVLGFKIAREGVPVRLSEPVSLPGPLEVQLARPVTLSAPLKVEVEKISLSLPERFSVSLSEPVEAEVNLLRCPQCRSGTLIPVRWNLLTGEITWRCSSCGHEIKPKP